MAAVERRRPGLRAKSIAPSAPTEHAVQSAEIESELRRLVHELQVHQMELEMQNDELRASRTHLLQAAAVFANSYDGILVCDGNRTIVSTNPAFTRITGYEQAEAVGNTPSLLSSGRQCKSFYVEMWQFLGANDFWCGEILNKRKDGSIYPQATSIAAVRSVDGALDSYVCVFSDITKLKSHEAELARVANYDPLTGLPNRRLFADRFRLAMARARRNGHPLAVCYLDLDGFKEVNDRLGHDAGDKLLLAVTQNIGTALRGEDTVARLGGDEFALLIDLQSKHDFDVAINRVMEAVCRPVQIGSEQVPVSASVGVTLYPDDDADADTLLRHADQAMYRAKESGRHRVQLFDPRQARDASAKQALRTRLRVALDRHEFVLHYQPKVDLVDGRVFGAEALIRWQHPEKGLLAPSAFLDALEGSEIESQVGEWVIQAVLQQIVKWQSMGLKLIVSANISPNHLLQQNFQIRLDDMLRQNAKADPRDLELEILESAAISDIKLAVATLKGCSQLGVRFAMDDFGTGYSSLAMLRQLPLDVLKIDQSFVHDMLVNKNDFALVEGVVRLAETFQREVIAEGVESFAHGAALVSLGCSRCQGFGIARPMPAEEFPDWMARWTLDKKWMDAAGELDRHLSVNEVDGAKG